MGSAKDLRVAPIAAAPANALVRRVHYSGKIVQNTQLHLGVFWRGRLEGVMQFGPSIDKRKLQGLVAGTGWNEFIEINRMAFSDALPRNSESRALGVAMRFLRRQYPQLRWAVSFADACQCGDGTIYRAAGFVLTGIVANKSLWRFPDGRVEHKLNYEAAKIDSGRAAEKGGVTGSTIRFLRDAGAQPLAGHQLRYLYFLDPSARSDLTVPVIPFAKIEAMGIGMYRGKRRGKQAMAGDHPAQRRGSTDPHAPECPPR